VHARRRAAEAPILPADDAVLSVAAAATIALSPR